MTPLEALLYSFLFGLLHGILPDEHTWPITFSYAIGGASGKEGIKAELYFSAPLTVQRMLISELAYLALAPFLLSPEINGIVYVVVGPGDVSCRCDCAAKEPLSPSSSPGGLARDAKVVFS
ncbi:MAG TPA: hypothetical protein VEK32_06055 [Thermodesulfobacteriota bacterium]|nr:hypothetical protein [Thermodesulfobacteriota bacterium]